MIRYAGKEKEDTRYITSNLYTECAFYPSSSRLVVINNSDIEQTTYIDTDFGRITAKIAAYDCKVFTFSNISCANKAEDGIVD